MQKNALLLCSLAIIAFVLQAEAITPVNNIVCGRAVCPSGWVSSDANATPTCPSDCPNSCTIMDDVCCPGRKYGVCSSTVSTAAGSGGETTETASGAAASPTATTASNSSAASASGSVTASSSASVSATSIASVASSAVVASSAASSAPAASSGSLIQPSYMTAFASVMICILKSL